jgi:uncharacterized protein (DUF2062 family)
VYFSIGQIRCSIITSLGCLFVRTKVKQIKVLVADRIFARLLALLKQGITPRSLSYSVSCGLTLGLLPFPWISTPICIAVAYFFRLNQIAMQIANYSIYPIQILFWYPLSLLGGQLIFTDHRIELSLLQNLLHYEFMYIIEHFGAFFTQAILGWLLLTPLLFIGFYHLCYSIFRRLVTVEIIETAPPINKS